MIGLLERARVPMHVALSIADAAPRDLKIDRLQDP